MALIKKAGTTKSIGAASKMTNDNGEEATINLDKSGTKRNIATPAMQPGVTLQDRYMIEGNLGVGGMSVVYRGRDLRFKDVTRLCAIKEMHQSAPDSNTRLLNLKNFEREAGLLAMLHHPAIPKVYDFFEENGRIYLILELVPGHDLEAVLDDAKNPIVEERVVQWAIQICDVLSYLHSHDPDPVIFRDLKPSNVMVTPDDRIMLIDFGIARNLIRADRKGTMIGTEGYSPPEQYRGLAEPRSDLYALGATLHHLLTAADPRLEPPFTFQERPIRQLSQSVSPEVESVIMRSLEYDLNDRWNSAEEMKEAFLGASAFAPQHTAGTPYAAPTARPRGKESSTELIWSFRCEDELRSSPCASGSMVFIGCYDTNLYAIDAKRGEFRWKYATEGGIAASPSVWEDFVYISSEDGVIYALDVRRGTKRWTFRTAKSARSSPRVTDRVVFVGSDDQHFYAIDGLRGTVIWRHRSWMPIRSSACITEEAVFVGGNDGHIYCFDIRNGSVKWKQKTQQPILATPAFADGLVLIGSMDNNFYALDHEGGWPVWRFRANHYLNSSPTVVGTRVFFGCTDGIMYALEIKNGRVAWKFDTGSQIVSSPHVENGRVYFGCTDSFVYCLDAGTGDLVWKYQTNGPVVSSPTMLDGVVYIGSMDQQLYALKG
ncbi:MAG: serine/threonine-protein kinase [Chloroflexi bacterium AL-W]|nr:serine/threonine-protein kinase [Chloroflexi bacterium AL-N1]NOK70896.1 serine/threonine-protein kinase [Chloroflexi bacterium AL-N10]NOK78565.1 serine/threonine-protein kinase [Chloroflexi bacterium AL-N5]NOK85797.1 serine/threonine-protein kinase [Chloroflexi bacterium AL-W]NOK92713.1 serine/threonine-protein kinase [Chloroflexi bacterium AL-N15]